MLKCLLFTYHRWQAAELAQAYWLACREILKNPEKFKFSTIEDLKTHIRNAAMAHSPDQYTSLIELTGSADNGKLVAAIKVLLAYSIDFFVIAPKGMQGTIAKRVNGDWDQIARIRGQTFPHMRVPVFLIQDAVTSGLEMIHPEHLFYTSSGEERMVWIDNKITITFAHLFVRSELDPSVTTIIRRLSETLAPTQAAATRPVAPVHDSDLLSTEIARYCNEKRTETIPGDKRSTTWSEETHDETLSKLKFFKDIVGDKPVLTISREDYKTFMDKLRRLPKARGTSKKTKGKTLDELFEMKGLPIISPSTVKQYHTAVTAFVLWLDNEYEGKGMNLTIQHALKASGIHKQIAATKEDNRLPFTDEHVSLMFESDKSIEYLTSQEIGVEKAWKLFVPALGVTSGARLNELCSFMLKDIGEENGIVYLDMNLDADELKSLKNKNAKRRIPLHPVMQKIHFMEYLEYMRSLHERKTDGRLFPTLTWIKGHHHRKYMTDWFNKEFLVNLEIKSEKLNFHSYRRRLLNILQRAANPSTTWRIDRFIGHEHGKKEPESIRTYLNKTLADTVPVLDDIKFGVDWTRYAHLCRQTYK